jgi:hypothetical protein
MQKEKRILPLGFTEQDVNESAPKLLTNGLVLYFVQTLSRPYPNLE